MQRKKEYIDLITALLLDLKEDDIITIYKLIRLLR